MALKEENQSYVIFDGSCGFCNYSAMFIAKRDVSNRFILVANSSNFGKVLLSKYNLEEVSPHSIILVNKGRVSIKSRAVRDILKEIPGLHFSKFLLKVIPTFVQNFLYDIIANVRKYLPVKAICEVPDSKLRKKFRL